MHVLMFAWGRGFGHITRCLAVAKAVLAGGGAQVTIVTGDEHRKLAEDVGCGTVALPDDLTRRGPWFGWTDPDHVADAVAGDLAVLDRVRPDVIFNDIRWSAIIAGEVAGVRCVNVVQDTMHPSFQVEERHDSGFWQGTRAALDQVLVRNGRPGLGSDTREIFYRGHAVAPSVPEFEAVLAADERVTFVGPLNFPLGEAAVPPAVYGKAVFVYGTIRNAADLDRLAAAFDGTGHHLLVAGADVQPAGPLSGITLLPLIDPEPLLPQCAAAVIHGGHGSCMSVLRAGIPAVVLVAESADAERIHNGRRLAAMGAARLLHGHDSWDHLAAAVAELTGSAQVRETAALQRQAMSRWDGAAATAELLRGLRPFGSDA